MQFGRKIDPMLAILSALAVAAAVMAVKPAFAADKGGPKKQQAQLLPEAFAPSASWTGCHVGGTIGMVAGVHDFGLGLDGYQGGFRMGCDVQLGRLVIGGGGD